MTSSNLVDQVFQPVYGLPCWNVDYGVGSFLTLEFGQPHLRIEEPRESKSQSSRVRKLSARRHVFLHGDWHLWLQFCEWHVYTGNKLIGDSALESSSKRRIARAARELDGQQLLQVTIDPSHGTSVMTFDLGSRLETKPYEPNSIQWMLYEWNGKVLTYCANGRLRYASGDSPREQCE
jgi:hypothetical protein